MAREHLFPTWHYRTAEQQQSALSAQEQCARDPSAFFDGLARRYKRDLAAQVIVREKLDGISPEQLIDLRERYEATCNALDTLTRRTCKCEGCRTFRTDARALLGKSWRRIVQTSTLDFAESGRLVGRSGWHSKAAYAKGEDHRESIRNSWVRRREHAARLGVSPQAVDHEGRILRRGPTSDRGLTATVTSGTRFSEARTPSEYSAA